MFRGLLLFALLATSCYAYKGHHMVAPPANGPCDYQSGHGFVFFSPNYDTSCDSFFIYHLGELECPHQYIVVAEVAVQPALKAAYCKAIRSGNETVFTIAPEFILPQFISGQIKSFTTQFYQGFFATLMFDSVTINLVDVVYGQMINVIQPDGLAYLLFEDSESNLFMSHVITRAPDFDQLLLVTIPSGTPENPPPHRKGPVYITFNMPNIYPRRLQEGQDYTGTVYGVLNGHLQLTEIPIHVEKNIYPGPNQANGNGLEDFKQYCVDTDRPVWDSCLALASVVV